MDFILDSDEFSIKSRLNSRNSDQNLLNVRRQTMMIDNRSFFCIGDKPETGGGPWNRVGKITYRNKQRKRKVQAFPKKKRTEETDVLP